MGDAAGALGLAFGLAMGMLSAGKTGQGSVVDAAITDVVAMLGGLPFFLAAAGALGGDKPSTVHESPFYDVYRCQDGSYISICAMEPQFYELLLKKLELRDVNPVRQYKSAEWPALKARMEALFLSRPRRHWCELLEGSDVCFAPVLSSAEACNHPHNVARETFADVMRPAPAPRFSAFPVTQNADLH
jgi:alpha-methylacyl-CoA racemase